MKAQKGLRSGRFVLTNSNSHLLITSNSLADCISHDIYLLFRGNHDHLGSYICDVGPSHYLQISSLVQVNKDRLTFINKSIKPLEVHSFPSPILNYIRA